MRTMKWNTSHAVFVTELDDEHKEIFDALSDCQKVFTGTGELEQSRKATERLSSRIVEHFAHEERLMRAARYESLPWHKHRHQAALRRVEGFVMRIRQGDAAAGAELVEYLTSWLRDHTRVADRMMGAALRNHGRSMWKMTFTAGTRPIDASGWVTATGEPFEPPTPDSAS
jgi:hemerythrin-like metal-binding protein